MPFRRGFLSLLSLCTFGALSLHAASVRIDPDDVLVPSFRGWGTSLCWWANVIGGLENHEEFADAIFKDLRLTIVRYNIGGGENPAFPELPSDPRARMEGFRNKAGEWNFDADSNQRRILRDALDRGVEHVDAFANSPPWWMTVSGSVTGGLNPVANNLKPQAEAEFATYLVTVMSELAKRDGIRFATIAPMNEPLSPWWYGNRQEGCHMDGAQQARVLDLLHTKLEEAGMTVGLIAPETFSTAEAIRALENFPAKTRERLRAVATHGYDTERAAKLRELTAEMPIWMSEYGDGDGSGMTMARAILDHLNILRAEEWVCWQAVEPDNGWGLVVNPLDGKSTECRRAPKFHVLRQFTNFIPPGSRILSTGDAASIAALPPDGRSLVVVAMNPTETDQPFSIDLSAVPTTVRSARVVRTSPDDHFAEKEPLALKDHRLDAILPKQSLTTFVLSLE